MADRTLSSSSDRTQFAIGPKKFAMPRVLKRTLQVVMATALTAGVALAVLLTNTLLIGRGATQGFDVWLGFIQRTDILGTMLLTALVTVCLIYWQREREGR